MSCFVGPNVSEDGLVLSLDAANPRSYSGSGNTWNDLSGNGYHLTIYGGPTFNTAGYFTFSNNQTTQYAMRYPFETPTTNITYSCWFRSNFVNPSQTPFTYSVNGNNEMLLFTGGSTQIQPWALGVAIGVDTAPMANLWVNIAWTRSAVTGVNIFYRDGLQIGTLTSSTGTAIGAGGYLIIGQESDAPGGGFDAGQNLDGDFARLDVYNRVLSAVEIRQGFLALRSRYGL